jgi:UDP-N-acetylglucosamine--N-acetylmuramyl-(pentapeptide) pyrophosphoryl-undecaprenol N-acetylglucosamine transferase
MSKTTHKKTILIMAGGTGGHIFPALAIAKELSTHSVNIEWLGSKRGMENTLVPKHNIKLHSVSAVGLRGKNLLALIKAPFLFRNGLIEHIGCKSGSSGFVVHPVFTLA